MPSPESWYGCHVLFPAAVAYLRRLGSKPSPPQARQGMRTSTTNATASKPVFLALFPAGDALARELVRLSCLVPCGSCLLAKAGVEAQPTTGAAGHAHIDYERDSFE